MAILNRLPSLQTVEVTVNNAAAAYTTGKTVGTAQTISLTMPLKGVRIFNALTTNSNEIAIALDLHFWDSPIAGQADQATFAHVLSEAKTYCGKIVVAGADYVDISGIARYASENLSDANAIMIPMQSNSFYMLAVAKSSSTMVNASNIFVQLKMELCF